MEDFIYWTFETRHSDGFTYRFAVHEHEDGVKVVQVDLSVFTLPVVAANAQELAAHDEVLVQIDKSSSDKTLWRKLA